MEDADPKNNSQDLSMNKEEVRVLRKAKASEAKARKAALSLAKSSNDDENVSKNSSRDVKSTAKEKEGKIERINKLSPLSTATAEIVNGGAKNVEPPGEETGSETEVGDIHPAFSSLLTKFEYTNTISNFEEKLEELFIGCEERSFQEVKFESVDTVTTQLLKNFLEFVEAYNFNESDSVWNDLAQKFQMQMDILSSNGLRPTMPAILNVINNLKAEIIQLKDVTVEEGKAVLNTYCENFITQTFSTAESAIFNLSKSKLISAKKILIFSYCPLVREVIKKVVAINFDIEIVFVLMPKVQDMHLAWLSSMPEGAKITFTSVKGFSSEISTCSLMLLGCETVLCNGAVLAEEGAAVVAVVAHEFNVPVIVLAQGYKMTEKIITLSYFDKTNFAMMERRYEVVPASLISSVITDRKIIA